ncbi:uncharacterized protein EAF01_002508 [Botrytis porri]|uniref:Uncharacterized protein n=1 Tax=Botrytis porri TaxID=87229 RepID=A0A4Z1KEV0_9HELO|nr:uncharacterized protein EAF01_002508 [Botrytis porri]KAF7911000.1 hypothetical protein EAF01_002508 [Botrytis porri]TGO82054.1 hypothetical protein BPOR_0933g00020 [Botrytis porri]
MSPGKPQKSKGKEKAGGDRDTLDSLIGGYENTSIGDSKSHTGHSRKHERLPGDRHFVVVRESPPGSASRTTRTVTPPRGNSPAKTAKVQESPNASPQTREKKHKEAYKALHGK